MGQGPGAGSPGPDVRVRHYVLDLFDAWGIAVFEIAAESPHPICVPEESAVGDPLARSVLGALAYADLFDYPLTIDEIARYQIATSFSREEIACALANSPDLAGVVSREGNIYS